MLNHSSKKTKISVVIPCYRVKISILKVINAIGPEVSTIYVVDDCCPEQSGKFVKINCKDPRVSVLFNKINLGVGGAVKKGYLEALNDGADIVVKLDGDGQMLPSMIPNLVHPLIQGFADYSKGNRFFHLEDLILMPILRIMGNSALSLFSKISTGYWLIFDPTNGYTAITNYALSALPLQKIDNRFFFESDMLFRLNLNNASVIDIPMRAIYGDEISNLKPINLIPSFLYKHLLNFIKRVFYNYYLRNMSIASLELPLGIFLLLFGSIYGASVMLDNYYAHKIASPGTVMLSGLTTLVGIQLLLAFISYDISATPKIRYSNHN